MSQWRIEQHYGFGAARIPIQPEPHRADQVGFGEGFAALVEELTDGGVIAVAQRVAGEASAMLLTLLIVAAVTVTLMRDHSDVSPVEVALFESIPPDVIPIIEVPLPEPAPPVVPAPKEIAQPKPEPVPKPKIPQQLAQRPKPKPVAKPLPVRPPEVLQPKIVMDAVRPEQASPAARADRIARAPADRTPRARVAPQVTAPAAPALDMPEEAPPKRAFRVASARSTSNDRARVLPAISPTSDLSEQAVPARSTRPSRTPGARPSRLDRPRNVAPALSPLAPLPGTESAPAEASRRATRAAPSAPTRRAPRPTALLARADTARREVKPSPVSRLSRESRKAPPGSAGEHVQLAGVPLAELAACLSDREEDRLKQAVVAAVTTQEECVSGRGTYRFIETKNLNAFLMWIDRAEGRASSDRCVELGYALECLQGASQQAAR